ncbi:MAG: hypothetical protein V1914_01840 [archaeon]
MKKLISSLVFPAVLALIACGTTGSQMPKLEELVKPEVRKVELKFGNNFVKAEFKEGKNSYERYEHTGFDGHKYCTQSLELPLVATHTETADIKVFDGDDGTCDNVADSFIVRVYEDNRFKMTQFCDSNPPDGHCIEATILLQNFLSSRTGRAVLYYWDKVRERCNKPVCKVTMEVPVKQEY